MYPNPANHILRIEMNDDFTDESNVSIFSINGQQVYSDIIKKELTLSLDSFVNGFYKVKVGNISRKLIIQK